MTNTILTDEVTMPPIHSWLGSDSARTRRSDPVTSHIAADRSSLHITESQAHVFELFEQFGAMTDSELGKLYPAISAARGWKRLTADSPRKRRSDLAGKGLLKDSGVRRLNDNGSKEVVWEVA